MSSTNPYHGVELSYKLEIYVKKDSLCAPNERSNSALAKERTVRLLTVTSVHDHRTNVLARHINTHRMHWKTVPRLYPMIAKPIRLYKGLT